MTRLRSSLLFLAAALLLVCASLEAVIPPPTDFDLCTCKFCGRNPTAICQISPSGYSIVCSDWAATHCPT